MKTVPVVRDAVALQIKRSGPDEAARARAIWLLAAIVCIPLLTELWIAAHKPFWFDELCTVTVATQHGFRGRWQALQDAVDTNPPVFYSVEALAAALPIRPELAYRIPAALGCALMQVFVFFVVLRRASPIAAGFAATATTLTTAGSFFSEARPYGLLLGAAALALFFWIRCERARSAIALALVLAIATSLHFYGVFLVLCLGLAELGRTVLHRRIRLLPWCALATGGVPLLVFLPLLRTLRHYYGANFWAKPAWSDVVTSYGKLLNDGVTSSIGVAVTVAVVSLMVLSWYSRHSAKDRVDCCDEYIGALSFIALPVIAVIAAKISGAGMTTRYMLPATIGLCVAAGLGAATFGRRIQLILLGSVALGMLTQQVGHAAAMRGSLSQSAIRPMLRDAVAMSRETGLPVVVSSGLVYFPAAHYLPGRSADVLTFLDDPSAALRFHGTDSLDLALAAISKYAPLHVRSLSSFRAEHDHFYLYTGSRGDDPFDWWPARLVADGYSLQAVRINGLERLYVVAAPGFAIDRR